MNKEQIYGIIRHGLTFVGGILVATGVVDDTVVYEISGSLMSLIGIIWSYAEKRKLSQV